MRSGLVPDLRVSTKCVVAQKNLTSAIDRSITRERDPECFESRFTLVEHTEATSEIVQQKVHEFQILYRRQSLITLRLHLRVRQRIQLQQRLEIHLAVQQVYQFGLEHHTTTDVTRCTVLLEREASTFNNHGNRHLEITQAMIRLRCRPWRRRRVRSRFTNGRLNQRSKF